MTHPGELLLKVLKLENMSQRELSRQLNISPSYVCDLCACRRGFGVDISLRLESIFGIAAEFWMSLQTAYDLYRARIKE